MMQLAELLIERREAAQHSLEDILVRQDDPYTQDGYYLWAFNAYKAAAERYRGSDEVQTSRRLSPFESRSNLGPTSAEQDHSS